MRALLLCAGLGTRLWPLTADRPKAAVRLGGRSLAEHGVSWLARHGVTEVTVNLHHQGQVLTELLAEGRPGVQVRYSHEVELLGTGGAIDRVRGWLGGRGTFVATNGKLVTEIDLSAALAAHRRSGALGTLVLRPNPDPARVSTVLIDEAGAVRGFIRPAEGDRADLRVAGPAPLMYAGIALWEPELLARLGPGASDVVSTLWGPMAAARPGSIQGHVDAGRWLEPSTLSTYLEAALELDPEGLVEEGARVADTARLHRSVVWRGASIGDGARLDACVVGEGARVPAGFGARREVLVRAELAAGLTRGPAGQAVQIDGALARVPIGA